VETRCSILMRKIETVVRSTCAKVGGRAECRGKHVFYKAHLSD
jgi:hypothetical protein